MWFLPPEHPEQRYVHACLNMRVDMFCRVIKRADVCTCVCRGFTCICTYACRSHLNNSGWNFPHMYVRMSISPAAMCNIAYILICMHVDHSSTTVDVISPSWAAASRVQENCGSAWYKVEDMPDASYHMQAITCNGTPSLAGSRLAAGETLLEFTHGKIYYRLGPTRSMSLLTYEVC